MPPLNNYGPYYQRQRAKIYRAFAKRLIEQGLAYPCFCTEDELNAVREEQTAQKLITGYYGKYAKCRNLSFEQIAENVKAGKPFVIRLKSQGNSPPDMIGIPFRSLHSKRLSIKE